MSDTDIDTIEDQYNSPKAPAVPEQNIITGNLTEPMLRYLKEAAPWLQFLGVLGFIICGITVLSGIVVSITSGYLLDMFLDWGNVPSWLIMIFYAAMGAIMFFPARFTYNFGSKISRYQYSNSDEDLEQALKNNKSLCKFYGIMGIIALAMIPLSFIVPVIIGIIAATRL